MNKVILMGRLTRDPELRVTQSGISQCSFAVAVDRRKAADGTQKADFINCVAWRERAEFISKYFAKGNKILVIGQIQTRDYENNEGRKVYVTEVIVDDVEFVESKGANSSNGGYQSNYNAPVDSAPASNSAPSEPAGNGYFALDTSESVPF